MKMKITITLTFDTAVDDPEAHFQALCDAFTVGDVDFYELAQDSESETCTCAVADEE